MVLPFVINSISTQEAQLQLLMKCEEGLDLVDTKGGS